MTDLVEDLLLLARLDSGRPLARETVDLTRLLLEAVSDARVVAPGHRWRLDAARASRSRWPATSSGCTRSSPTCSPTPASTPRPAPR